MMSASRRRLLVLYVVVFTLLITLGGRLWYIQVMNGTSYVKLASQNQTRKIIVPAVRGQILDDEGNPLVANRTELVVSVDMMTLSQRSDGGTSVLKRLAPMLNMPYQLLAEKTRLCTAKVKQPCWAGSPYQPIPVDENVSEQVALQIMEEQNEFPGISAQTEGVVTYQFPHGANPAQVVGYLQPATTAELKQDHLPSGVGYSTADEVGQAGLEEQYNQALTGKTGTNTVSVNAAGDVTGSVASAAAQPGDDLVTSLNSSIQADAQNALASAIKKAHAAGNNTNQGAAVVMTTKGQIVAMASYPDYNPSVWTNGITQSEFNQLFGSSDGAPAINYATQGEYAPGSTWKVTSTAAGVADGYGLDQTYNCPASVTIGGHEYKNDGEPSQGQMSYAEALIQSCDTVYYDLGYNMWQSDDQKANVVTSAKAPVQKMQQMALDWGFGQATGIDLPEESTGTVPTREWLYYYWKDNAYTGQHWCRNGRADGTYVQQIEYQDCKSGNVWEPGQAAIAAIGQGYDLSTPLQLTNAYVALANGGTLYQPRIGEGLISPSGQVVQQIEPAVAGHLPVSKNTLAYIRNALQGVVTQGTAASAFGGYPEDKVCVAGKTGTAQVMGKVATSVFASFAPCNDPKYVVVVMIPDAGYGADVSAPAARQIWDGIYGLEGHQAAVPNGQVPSTLPQIASTGKITAPKGYSG